MRGTVVKVVRPILDAADPWRAYDENRQHESLFQPDEWLRAAQGARMVQFYLGTWGIPPNEIEARWLFSRRLRSWFHW